MAKILKTKAERLQELSDALRLVSNSVKSFFSSGHDRSYLLAVTPQLRALVAFNPNPRSKGAGNLNPLLLNLAEEDGVELRLFSRPPKPENGPPGFAAVVLASKTWSVEPVGDYVHYRLREWLLVPAYHEDATNTFKSRNEIIRQMADKSASHYDAEVGATVDSQRRVLSSGIGGLEFFTIDTSAAVFYLGQRYLTICGLKQSGTSDPEAHESIRSLDRDFQNLRISMI